MFPPAPRRGSGTICWPIAPDIFAARRRATTSVPPANGSTTRIGLEGNGCASAAQQARATSPARTKRTKSGAAGCLVGLLAGGCEDVGEVELGGEVEVLLGRFRLGLEQALVLELGEQLAQSFLAVAAQAHPDLVA